MSLFDENLTSRISFTAQTMADCEDWTEENPNKIGRINGFWEYSEPYHIDLSSISQSTLDEIIDNVLIYIYYYTKLGFNHLQLNKFQISISTRLFGVTSKNWKSDGVEQIMDYVIGEFEKKGFEVTHNPRDARIVIGWYKKVYKN